MGKQKLTIAEKKALKAKKMEDPYGIDDMSDEEFLEKLPELRRKAGRGGIFGFILFLAAIILLAVLWDNIFWG